MHAYVYVVHGAASLLAILRRRAGALIDRELAIVPVLIAMQLQVLEIMKLSVCMFSCILA